MQRPALHADLDKLIRIVDDDVFQAVIGFQADDVVILRDQIFQGGINRNDVRYLPDMDGFHFVKIDNGLVRHHVKDGRNKCQHDRGGQKAYDDMSGGFHCNSLLSYIRSIISNSQSRL